MNATRAPDGAPSAATLLKASIAAIVLAVAALATVILPAEFGIDPTGLGGRLGLTALAEASAVQARDDALSGAPRTAAGEPASHTIEVAVPAGGGVEYKFAMAEGAKLTYEWLSDGSMLYLDLHGEPEGDATGYFESYVEATADRMKGSFTAPFDGSHGWYWRNDTDEDVAVLLKVRGRFEVLGLK